MNRTWLEQRVEAPVDPDLEIVDAHHHLWDTETRYGRYDLDDLHLDTDPESGASHHVVQTVFIDCGASYRATGPEALRPVGETEFVAERADRSDRSPKATIAAIVSHADLTLGSSVAEVLEAHVEAAGGRFRGIRHSGARTDVKEIPTSRVQPPADLYRGSTFREGARVLADMGLSFEAWQYHPQLDMVADLARNVPELSIVVNHLGGPIGVGRYRSRWDDVLAEVRAGLAELADLENVTLKLGGIGMTRFGARWHENALPPSSEELLGVWGDLLRFAIETFGPDRCMFESNFPVDGETTAYSVLWNTFTKASAGFSDAERADLFAGTARRVYRIDPPT